jgi:hypothetical protein
MRKIYNDHGAPNSERRRLLIITRILMLLVIGIKGGDLLGEVEVGTWDLKNRDLAPFGHFFATTDFGFEPGKPDIYKLTRGRIKRSGKQPSVKKPWISTNKRTLFCISFDEPLNRPSRKQHWVKKLSSVKSQKFNKILIAWGGNVPVPDGWGAYIVTEEEEVIVLPIEDRIYPHDITTINFKPTTIHTLYIGLKGIEGGIDNYVEVKIYIFSSVEKSLDKITSVNQRDCYLCIFDTKKPGCIAGIIPLFPYILTHRQRLDFLYGLQATYYKGILTRIFPFIEIKKEA